MIFFNEKSKSKNFDKAHITAIFFRATCAKLIQHTRHINPDLYMPTTDISRTSQAGGSRYNGRGYGRRGCTRQGSVMSLGLPNNNEHDGQDEEYEKQPSTNMMKNWKAKKKIMYVNHHSIIV